MERIIPAEDRLKTLLYLPFCEPKECERMVEEFGDNPDVLGFMVTSVWYKSVHHDSYMRLCAMLEEVGEPLCFHAGNNWQDDDLKQLDTFYLNARNLVRPMYHGASYELGNAWAK